jgi:hypothetical protein
MIFERAKKCTFTIRDTRERCKVVNISTGWLTMRIQVRKGEVRFPKHWIGICLVGLSFLGMDYERPRKICATLSLG